MHNVADDVAHIGRGYYKKRRIKLWHTKIQSHH